MYGYFSIRGSSKRYINEWYDFAHIQVQRYAYAQVRIFAWNDVSEWAEYLWGEHLMIIVRINTESLIDPPHIKLITNTNEISDIFVHSKQPHIQFKL